MRRYVPSSEARCYQTSSNFRDLNKLQEGIGEKIGMFVFFMTIFSASLINAFIHGWELTLIILSVMPVNRIKSKPSCAIQNHSFLSS